ncbi:cellulose synthase-like protein E6 [Rosa rugosa]|uniref:cellulose synthase-like protein E6 n=1 Tax=Rosa rugosa TaxID=74645 RepID=UPI002B40D3D9|nr:cellulose synthase-like protein E6 [Rosa rugosa]
MGKKEGGEGEESSTTTLPLFESKTARFRGVYRVFASTIFVGVCLIWLYRLINIPKAGERGRWAWIGMLMAEFLFGLYWIITQSVRWSVTYRQPLKNRLSQRYEEKLPGVDVFICTADPKMEPPSLVINTVLSVLSCNFPSEKLSVYLSDDGGSQFTFYALLEASRFSKYWIPFCKKFKVEPRAPEAYFALHSDVHDTKYGPEWFDTKKLYEEMKNRIDSVVESGKIPEETRIQHKGFSEWNLKVAKNDHHSIVQIITDGRDTNAVDNDGCRLPTIVYMSREKRPQQPHNFKAGAMNALLRVSSEISNAPFILNLDCDMYANNADAIREALCFFLDEKTGHETAYVQHPQFYNNLTKNDIYGNACFVTNAVELAGLGGYGAALYCGTGCFHRRECLCGKKYSKGYTEKWNIDGQKSTIDKSIQELEESTKPLIDCIYEKGSQWGKEMGLIYGCPVEDIVTGLAIQCRGWKSVYYNPERPSFVGVAPNTLEIALVQQKRWSEGMFQIFFSEYCPFIYGHGKIHFGAQMGYCLYLLWAPVSFPTLYYALVPPLCLLHGIPSFPKVSSLWFLAFAYVFVAKNAYSIVEFVMCGGTLKAW